MQQHAYLCFTFLRQSCYVGQAGLELLVMLLSQPPKYWDYRFGDWALGQKKRQQPFVGEVCERGDWAQSRVSLLFLLLAMQTFTLFQPLQTGP